MVNQSNLRLVSRGDDGALPLQALAAQLQEVLAQGDDGVIDAANVIVRQAILHGCSDVHIEPSLTGTVVRYRIDGVLHTVAELPAAHHDHLVARYKVLAKIPTYQKGGTQDGRIDFQSEGQVEHLRLATLPVLDGEKIVLRLMQAHRRLLDLDELGLPGAIVDDLRELVRHPQGVLLLTGPSSSGKTTTLYALLREVQNTSSRNHIVTLEDPVEFRLPGVTQSQTNADQGYDLNTALRAVLRQDPDVLMIGEIRDSASAKMAVQAGLTGHLVLSTIHSGTAAGVFARLLDMGIEPFLVASAVNGVLAQRLLRRVCPACAEAYVPDAGLAAKYLGAPSARLMRGVGCDSCQGVGYKGRAVIAEFLPVDPSLSDEILARRRISEMQSLATGAGMKTLLQHGREKVLAGETTLEELQLAVAPDAPA